MILKEPAEEQGRKEEKRQEEKERKEKIKGDMSVCVCLHATNLWIRLAEARRASKSVDALAEEVLTAINHWPLTETSPAASSKHFSETAA